MSSVSISASIRPSARAALVSVTVTDVPAGTTMAVWRRVGAAPDAPVMGAGLLPARSAVIVDPEAPLNREVRYIVSTSVGLQSATEPLTVPADLATIADPVRGVVADCAVIDRDNIRRANRAEVLLVEADPTPHVVWDVPTASQMPVQILTLTSDASAAMERILANGDQILLRCPCGHHDDVWIQPVGEETGRSRVVGRAASPLRVWDLGDCVIYPTNPLIDVAARANTLGDVDAAVTPKTLGAIASRWATLAAIAEADLAS